MRHGCGEREHRCLFSPLPVTRIYHLQNAFPHPAQNSLFLLPQVSGALDPFHSQVSVITKEIGKKKTSLSLSLSCRAGSLSC